MKFYAIPGVQGVIALDRNNIISFRKLFLLAAIILYYKQWEKLKSASEHRPPPPLSFSIVETQQYVSVKFIKLKI